MKKLLILFTFLLLGANLLAQSANDVVYLKNGSVIKGTVSNVTPNETVTIQTSDGSVFVLNMSEVTQIAHGENAEENISFPSWANDIMTRKGSRLFVGNRKLSENEILELLNEDLYKNYSNGLINRDLGTVLIIGGIAFLGISIDFAVESNNIIKKSYKKYYGVVDRKALEKGEKIEKKARILAFPSFTFLTFGFIFREIGNDRLEWVVNEYNNPYGNSVSFNLQPGIISTNGLAFQNTSMAPGLKFTVTF